MNNEEALADFRRRWEGTYVWLALEEKGEDALVYVNRVESNENKVGVLHLTSEKLGSLTINLGSDGHSLQFRYPPVGVFQHGGDAMVFLRRPSRQYRRGICSDNSSMYNVTRSVTGVLSTQWSVGEIQSAFDHKVSTFADALAQLRKKGIRSVALRNNYALSLSMTKEPDYVLWHWTHPVARISSTGAVVKVLEPAYAKHIIGVTDASGV